jgi:predicted permease
MDFIQTLLLLLAITALGMFSRYKQLFAASDKLVLNGFIYRFALPALFIDTISSIKFNQIEIEVIIGSVLPILLSILLILLLHLLKVLNKEQMIISSITLGFGSNAFFGIAYFDSLYGGEILEFAVFTASILGMLGVVLSIAFLEYAKSGTIKVKVFSNVLKSPPVFAIFIGLALAFFGLHIEFFDKASALLGKTAGGLAIFVLGMFIYDNFSIKLIKEALPYVLLRALLLPIITFLVLLKLPDITNEMYILLFQQSGIPTAIALAIVAQRYEYHEKKISAIVMFSSLFSFFILGLLYALS